MTTATAVRTYMVPAQLNRQISDMEKLVSSHNYMGTGTLDITLGCRVEILLGKGDESVTFPVGSTLTWTQADHMCILQHPTVGRVTFRWDDLPGEGTFVPPGR